MIQIYTHPENKPYLRDLLAKYATLREDKSSVTFLSIESPKIQINFTDEFEPSAHYHHEFPKDPLIEYEEKDSLWMYPLRMCRRIYDMNKPFVYGTLNGHPYIFDIEQIIRLSKHNESNH